MRSRARLKLGLLLILCLVSAGRVRADGELLANLSPAKNGTFKLGDIEFAVQHKSQVWAPAWQRALVVAPQFPQSTPDSFTVQGKLPTDSGTYDFVQEMKQVGIESVAYSASLKGTPTKESRFLCLSLLLPVNDYRAQQIFFDAQPVALPWWTQGQALLKAPVAVKTVRVPLKGGGTLLLEGDFTVNFQDNRSFTNGSFDLQLYFSPHSGSIGAANLAVTLKQLGATDPLAVAYNAEAKQPARAKPAAPKPQNFVADAALIKTSLAQVKPLSKVIPRGEDFVNEKGQKVRFWGVNLVAFYPEHSLADKTAEHLADLGINMVRPHHNLRPSRDWSPADAIALATFEGDSRTPNLKAWDRYDYLNAKLREKNIYLALSIGSSRVYQPDDAAILKVSAQDDEAWAEAMDDLNHWNWRKATDPRKMLAVFDERAFLLNAEYARQLLTHVNPYTGIAYGKDPQVVSLELINEFSSEYILVCGNTFPEYWTQKLEAQLKAFLQSKNAAPFTIYGKKNNEQKKLFSEFCNGLDENYARRMEKVIREANYAGPLEASNLWRGDSQLAWRNQYDGVIEDHAYDDPLVVQEPNRFLATTTRSALAGKPLVIGEFNQSEDPAIIKERASVLSMLPIAGAAYGSLQNVAGINWFAWTHGTFELDANGWGKPSPNNAIGAIAGNEAVLTHLRSCGIIYKNGYLSSSVNPQTIMVDPAVVANNYNELMSGQTPVQAGWQAVHGFRKAFGAVPPSQQTAPWAKGTPPQPTVSDTDQILRDTQRRQLSFAAPKTEGFSGYLDGQAPAKLAVLGITGTNGFASVVAVSLDDKPLRGSRHILLSRTYTNAAGKNSEDLPVTLKGIAAGKWGVKITRSASGTTEGISPLEVVGGTLTLPAGLWHECEIELSPAL